MADDQGVVIGYDSRLATVLGVSAALVALLFWVRAIADGSLLDGLVAVVLSLAAIGAAVIAVAGRSPLLVADHRGVRAKVGNEWCGFPWVSVSEYLVETRRLPWTDGWLLIAVQHSSHLNESLSPRAQRKLLATQRRHHAELALPLGPITRVSRRYERQLSDRLAELIARSAEPEW